MVIDPQQELFSALKVAIEKQGYDVYDGFLPPDNTPYPFVYLGDFRQSDSDTKSQIIGSVFPTIHIWHNNPRQRGTVSNMMLVIKEVCRLVEHTANYKWLAGKITQRIIPDKTKDNMPLMHGIIEAEFKFS